MADGKNYVSPHAQLSGCTCGGAVPGYPRHEQSCALNGGKDKDEVPCEDCGTCIPDRKQRCVLCGGKRVRTN